MITLKREKIRRFIWMALAILHIVLVDQIIKEVIVQRFVLGVRHDWIPSVFGLTYVRNNGCAWGMLPNQTWALAIFGLIALVFLIWKRKAIFPDSFWGRLAEVFLDAGILGNLIDRFFRGFVVDMFDYHWGFQFPVFNLADVCITCAAGILIASSILSQHWKNPHASDSTHS